MAVDQQTLREALAESQQRLTQLSEAMYEAVAIHDDGTIVDVNHTCLELFGYRREELVGRPALELAAEDWRSRVSEHIDSGSPDIYQALGVRKDGSTFWGELRAREVPYGGRPLGLVVIRDISEHREAELEQHHRLAQERVHRAVLEMESVEDFAGVVLVIGDVLEGMGVDYQAVGLNILDETAGTLTAYALMSDRLSVQAVNELSHPSNQELLEYWRRDAVWERSPDAQQRELSRSYSEDAGRPYEPDVIIDVPFQEGTLVVGLLAQVGRNDELISLLRRFCPLVSLGYARTLDMAERARAEAALRQAHDELETRVRDRTAEMSSAVQALQREIAVRQAAEVQLQASLDEKDVLLKEIHHRVKNNLQIISSLLSLQSGQVADQQVQSYIEDTRNRVMSMALIHESLYQSTQLDRIDMVSYISTLTRRLFESHAVDESRIAVHLETESVELGIEAAIPCGLILNELVSNALQHAFPTDRSGSLSVKLSQDDTGYRLSVSDDGVGLAADVVIEDSDTLGLTLVHTLCAQLRATYEIQRGPGTAFHLHVPAGS